MTDPEQRRLRRSAVLHGFAVVVFAMLALAGFGAATQGGLSGLAVPFIVTGLAGAGGAAVITVAVWRGQTGTAGRGRTGDVRGGEAGSVRRGEARDEGRGGAPQRGVRLAMVGAAVVVLVAGVVLAPQGMDRGFVIGVAGLLAAVLGLFALLSGDRPRTGPALSQPRV